MKESEKLQAKIEGIQKTIDNPATPSNFLPTQKAKLEELKGKLKDALEKEAEEEKNQQSEAEKKAQEAEKAEMAKIAEEQAALEAKQKQEKEEEEAKAEKKRLREEAKAAKLAEKEQAKKDRKAKRTPAQAQKITAENLEGCVETLKQNQFRVTKISESLKHKSPVHRKLSTVVADKVSNTITGALRKEITKENINKIDVEAWKEVKADGIKFLKSLRKASGGIADDNAEMIKRFTASFDELLDEILTKKEEWAEAA